MGQNGSKLPAVKPILNPEVNQPNEKPLSRKHEIVAELAARGLDTDDIAEQVRLRLYPEFRSAPLRIQS